MSFKEALTPNKGKLIVSATLTLLWYLLIYVLAGRVYCNCMGVEGVSSSAVDFYPLLLNKRVVCGCTPVGIEMVVMQYFIFLILPFGLSYLIYSTIEYLITKIKK